MLAAGKMAGPASPSASWSRAMARIVTRVIVDPPPRPDADECVPNQQKRPEAVGSHGQVGEQLPECEGRREHDKGEQFL